MIYGVATIRNQDTQKKNVSNFMEKNKYSAMGGFKRIPNG